MTVQKKLLIGFGSVLFIAKIAFISVYYSLIKSGGSYNQLAKEEMEKLTLTQEIQYEDLVLSSAVQSAIKNLSNMAAELQNYLNRFKV